jgi:hypothetical protein
MTAQNHEPFVAGTASLSTSRDLWETTLGMLLVTSRAAVPKNLGSLRDEAVDEAVPEEDFDLSVIRGHSRNSRFPGVPTG